MTQIQAYSIILSIESKEFLTMSIVLKNNVKIDAGDFI